MGALTSPEVGKFVNENFVSSFQKVATFKITADGQKQGGNVATYFCAPDGRVLHLIAGPVDAATFLREAKWVVDTTKDCIARCNGDGGKFKALFRTAHAEKLRQETGLAVEPVTFDPPEPQGANDALTYRDPSGQPLAPRLPPPPIDGPDVRLKPAEFEARQNAANAAPGARTCLDKRGGRVVVNNQAIVHQLMSAHSMCPIEQVYGTVFENVLGEKISTKPVDVDRPFSWNDKQGNRLTK
ncbi:MAG TPA: hypothetical protein VKE74_15610 [Gemmataceae bacterium]|nr:hypothetical protein [Gemmataceae bacterium]